jgi:uncharacterized membrane protein
VAKRLAPWQISTLKMSNPKYLRWLYDELPNLMARGILTPEQAAQLRAHYGEVEDKPALNIGFLVASILGALLVGSGIILIFAYNWENLSRTWRTILSFAPLLIAQGFYGYAFFYRRRELGWTEGASAFLMLMVAASIALVSQTYHIWGEPETFLWNWLLLSVSLIYLLNSSLVAMIYLVGIASWTMQVADGNSVWYWGLFGLVIPHLVYNWRKRTQLFRRDALGWVVPITFLIGWFGTIETHLAEYSLLGTMVVISGFYALGERVFPIRSAVFTSRPMRTSSVIGSFIFLLILTYDTIQLPAFAPQAVLFGFRYPVWAGVTNFIILLAIVSGYIYLIVKYFPERKWLDHFATLLPILGLLTLFLNRTGGQTLSIILANTYLLAWGIFYLLGGIQERRMPWVNIGMFFILALATVRFFDTNWSPLVKGVIFILLGGGFLAANLILSKRLKLKTF